MELAMVKIVKEHTDKMKGKVKEAIDDVKKKIALSKQVLEKEGLIEHTEKSNDTDEATDSTASREPEFDVSGSSDEDDGWEETAKDDDAMLAKEDQQRDGMRAKEYEKDSDQEERKPSWLRRGL